MILEVCKAQSFKLAIEKIASDKSISHRCAIFSLLSDKPSYIQNYLKGEDTLDTLKIAKRLGLEVKEDSKGMVFLPPKSIKEPSEILDCGNAGTAIRLYLGLLSAQKGMFVLSGDRYLNNRPMKRVVEPLSSFGAIIFGRDNGNFAPLIVIGIQGLKSIEYVSKITCA